MQCTRKEKCWKHKRKLRDRQKPGHALIHHDSDSLYSASVTTHTVHPIIRQTWDKKGQDTNNQVNLTNKQTNKQTNRQTDRQTDRQTNKQTNRQTNRQTNKQTNKTKWQQNQMEVLFTFFFYGFYTHRNEWRHCRLFSLTQRGDMTAEHALYGRMKKRH